MSKRLLRVQLHEFWLCLSSYRKLYDFLFVNRRSCYGTAAGNSVKKIISTYQNLLSIHPRGEGQNIGIGTLAVGTTALHGCFSHLAHWLPTRKNCFTRWPNTARGLLHREKRTKEKVWRIGVIIIVCTRMISSGREEKYEILSHTMHHTRIIPA